jgi:hypothetical protein
MLKTLMMTTAVSGLLVGAAMAQSSPSAPTTPAPGASPSMNATGNAQVVDAQKPDQWLATKFKGTDVLGADDKKIGDVSDILFDQNGKIEAYIVGVGGFLGVGEKEVALAPSSFTVVKGQNGGYDKLKVTMTQEQLKEAANFKPYSAPSATTGAGSTSPRPMGVPGSTNR